MGGSLSAQTHGGSCSWAEPRDSPSRAPPLRRATLPWSTRRRRTPDVPVGGYQVERYCTVPTSASRMVMAKIAKSSMRMVPGPAPQAPWLGRQRGRGVELEPRVALSHPHWALPLHWLHQEASTKPSQG